MKTEALSPLKRAFLALEAAEAKLAAMERERAEPIAIIGMGCRLPGGADDPEAFWRLLRDGVDTVGEIPADRWDVDRYYDPNPDAPGKMSSRWGAFVEGVDQFDPQFFNISPREAVSMDPQQRLLLEVAWEALEHAGQAPDGLVGSRTGVFVGMSKIDYLQLQLKAGDPTRYDVYYASGGACSIASGRLSYVLGLQGPSVTVDTACSSSLVAFHLACQSLRCGECRMALAGGVNLILAPENTIAFCKSGMIAPDGRCKTFDAAANGFVQGEGCAMAVLKRLSDALADGDPILALARSSAVNQDGASSGLTAPNGPAQEAVIREALARGNVRPSEVSYVEAHGTGTSLGDPIEVQALNAVLRAGRSPEQPLLVGSVKTNIGHLEAAAGIAGLVKVVLALQHKTIPPHLHFREPNPHIPWADLCVQVPAALTPWTPANGVRIAGLSSFGFSGTNAHVVLEEAPARRDVANREPATPERPLHLLTLSAANGQALRELAGRYRRHLQDRPSESLADLCFTANTGRARLDRRLAILADSREGLLARLAAAASGRAQDGVASGRAGAGNRLKVAFLFTGQGAQYQGMGRQLYETQPVFREALERCDRILRDHLERPLLSVLYAEPGSADAALLDQTAYTQPALFAIEYALAALWRSWGIEPSAVLGHSVGEYVAACVAGVFSLEQGLRLIAERARLMQALPGGGRMAAVRADEARVAAAIAGMGGHIAIAAVNGPDNVVVSGEGRAVEALVERLEGEAVQCTRLAVSYAFHSALMEPMLGAFEGVASEVRYASPRITLISNVTGRPAAGSECASAAYWRRHVREPVRFSAGMEAIWAKGYRVFLEVGPSPVLLGMGANCVPAQESVWLPSLRRGQDDWRQLLASLAGLYVRAAEVDWAGFDRGYPRRRLRLPTYPFQRRRYWLPAVPEGGPAAVAVNSSAHPLLGRRLRIALKEVVFEAQLEPAAVPFLADHVIHGRAVLPTTAYLEMMAAAARAHFGEEAVSVSDLVIHDALAMAGEGARTVQLILTPRDVGTADVQLFGLAVDDSEPEVPEPRGEEWKLYATGSLGVAAPQPQEALQAAQARCDQALDPEAFYRALWARGLHFGPSFQGVRQVWRRDGEAVGEIRLPETLVAEAGVYRIHPALLDACVQVLAAAVPGFDPEDTESDVYMPIGLDRFDLLAGAGERLLSHARLEPAAGPAPETRTGHVRIVDGTDRPVAQLAGLRLKRASRHALLQGRSSRLEEWLYQVEWRAQALWENHEPVATLSGETPGSWLIFVDNGGVGEELAKRLRLHGQDAVLVSQCGAFAAGAEGGYVIDPARPEDFHRLVCEVLAASRPPCRGVIHLWSLDEVSRDLEQTTTAQLAQAQINGCRSVLYLVQALTMVGDLGTPALWVVSRDAQPVGSEPAVAAVAHAPLWGLGKVIALEHPELRCVRVDLGPSTDADDVEALFQEICSSLDAPDESLQFRRKTPDRWGREDQIAYRGMTRYVARLVRSVSQAAPAVGHRGAAERPVRLDMTTRGILDNLELRPMSRTPPGPGEVEIRVHATGLNFRDVLNALGVYSGGPVPFGGECAGEITALGKGVNGLRVGDPVMAIATHCFSTFVIADAALVTRVPERLSFRQAAGIPIAFLTAHYALHRLGRMAAGDRVLIHAGAGGVGMAAVQMAQRAGAEVYTTAGSPEKREFLKAMGVRHVMDSRSLDFAEQVMAATGGRGVDLVLNSLAGEFIPKSLAVLAPGGRFLGIGRSDIWSSEQVASVRDDIEYFPIDLTGGLVNHPEQFRPMMDDVLRAMAEGTLKPLPSRVFPLPDVIAAFRYMAQGKHIGKIVVAHPVEADGTENSSLFLDGTVLITGGLGGLGLFVARWMVDQGVRNLALVGRRPPSQAASDTLRDMGRLGARVRVFQADASHETQVAEVLRTIRESMPPLYGVIHAAAVLADGVLVQQGWRRFSEVMAPKVQGAWVLHRLTRHMPLRFFALFSSVASVFGSPGQGNYAAANAFIDALAYYRQARGLPAVSINWGPWGGAGAAVEHGVAGRVASKGIGVIAPEQGLQLLEQILRDEAPQVAVVPVDWHRFIRQFAADGKVPPLLAEFARVEREAARPRAEQAREVVPERLAQIPPNKRRQVILARVRDEAARVLGLDASCSIDPGKPLRELGFDSLMAVELRNALGAAVGQKLPATLLFDYPTLEAVTDHLVSLMLPAAPIAEATRVEGAEVDDSSHVLADIEQLSDEEVDRLFEETLKKGS